ncbi:uncharacterized protein LOC132741248 [Ruditapes philippinarum]|uniref:uncharacterized protein LOC132741248 n=1 Tax=Ruditapes philippinarum TaxID=129788 RepID=UPI00295C304C|nr:uncharacterized protein LOC132741248 [Ruditapes philippinarum]
MTSPLAKAKLFTHKYTHKYGDQFLLFHFVSLCKEDSFDQISSFEIQEFNEFSDHAPLAFSINSGGLKDHFDQQTHGEDTCIRWDSDKRDAFRRSLISKLPDFNAILIGHDNCDKTSINKCVSDFVSLINNVASPLFKTTVKKRKQTGFVHKKYPVKRSQWFDNECHNKKLEYLEALQLFNCTKTDENRNYFNLKKREYKTVLKRKKKIYTKLKMSEIENLRGKNPKAFWSYFSKKKCRKGENIDIADFYEYFKGISEEISISGNHDAEEFCKRNLNHNDVIYEELDGVITSEEILKAIKSLKRGKAGSLDHLINEYFIEAGDILIGHIVDIFNNIFDSGYFPDQWMEGLIIPLYKKGDENQVNNYRGITLISCIAKLFTSVLNNRLTCWSCKYNINTDAQFGFRAGFSTTDAIFALHTLVENMLNNGKRLYVAMVDMKKIFDSINRNALWYKLYNLGISGKMLRMLRSMYTEVRSKIKH